MKTLKYLIYLLLGSVLIVGCSRDFDEPPLSPPVYDGPPANKTIAEIKEMYKDITDPTLIEVDYIIKAYVSGNDVSGNIYKQLYIQDASGAINIGIDQNSMYTEYRVGQEVYINLHGLYMVKYGGELQIGYIETQANRIPWLTFNDHASKNDFPNPANVVPLKVELGKFTEDMVNKLVVVENIYFVNADGKTAFTADNATTNQPISNANGNRLDVRTSSFSPTLAKRLLPEKYGTVTGILGRYNGGWQLFLRDVNDIGTFGAEGPSIPPVEGEDLFMETFGTGYYPSGNRPKIAAFTDFDMKSPIKYTDPSTNADIRSMSGDHGAHVWLPAVVGGATAESYLIIEGINTEGKSNIVFSFEVCGNVYNPTDEMNLSALKIKVNGVEKTIDKKVTGSQDKDVFHKFEFKDFPAAKDVKIEFHVPATGENALGMRLDNIRIYTDDTIVPTP